MTYLNIAHLQKFTVPGGKMSWIPENDWGPEQNKYFLDNFPQNYSSSERFSTKKRLKNTHHRSNINESKQIATHFILQEDHVWGYCTVQVYDGYHYTHAYIIPRMSSQMEKQDLAKSLASLITVLFAATNFDYTYVIVSKDSTVDQVLQKWPGYSNDIISLVPGMQHSLALGKCIASRKFCIDKSSWQNADPELNMRKHLSYIERRAERKRKANDCNCSKNKRRSFISRLFNPRINDSIF